MASDIVIKLKHAGATHDLTLNPAHDCPYEKIAALLDLPKERIKIIRLGKLLPPKGDQALSGALIPGGVYLVSGTARDAQLPSDTRRRARQFVTDMSMLFSSITWAAIYAWLVWFLVALMRVPKLAFQFVSSMVVPPAPSQLQQQRVARQHND